VNLLKGTPFENPLAALSGMTTNSGGKSAGEILGALLNPSMLAEFKKIRSSAIGITGISGNHPAMISVLYPGKSDALRGLLVAGLSMAGTPGAPIEGLSRIQLPDDMAVAYDDKIVIAARPAAQLVWAVKQYKGRIAEPSLAADKSFAKVKQTRREQNALTLWANVDEAYAQALKMFPAANWPPELVKANALADFANIDDLILTQSFETNGFNLKADVGLKEGNHCLAYQLFRTSKISKDALEAVPADAIALASFSLSEPEPAQAALIRAQILSATKVDFADELFTNIQQITLFLMPAKSDAATNVPLQGRLGLALTSRNPAQTRQMLTTLAAKLTGTQPDPKANRFKVGNDRGKDQYAYIDQAGSATVVSLDRDIVDASTAALKNHKSVCVAGPLSRAVNELTPSASKTIFVNVGGALRLIAPQVIPERFNEQQAEQLRANLAQLAHAADATTLSWRTIEQPTSLEVNATLTGIPPLSELAGPATQIARLDGEARAAENVKRLQLEMPAVIAQASTPPAIDGTADKAWKAARAYKLENVNYTRPASPADFSANYRALWDANNLYVRVDVTDDVLRHDSPADKWYESDGVEVFIDADDAKASAYGQNDYQYAFNWDKTSPTMQEIKHSRTNGVQYALVTTDKGYCVVIKFPWTTLGVTPSAGAKIGLDVHANDNDGGGKRKTKITWHDDKDLCWNSPQSFGNAELAGLVGWWKFDETQGTSAADSSGGNHTGTLMGHAKWAKGRIGGAIDLDGANSFVRIADKSAFNFGGETTLAAWVNFRSVPADWTAIIAKGDEAWRLSTVGKEQKIHFAVGSGSGICLNSATAISANEWHHVVGAYDGSVLRIYIDGKLEPSASRAGGITRNNREVFIGGNVEHKERCFDGLLDEVRVYNYALPETEIQALAAGH
jgi:hypothetical protein